MQETKDSNKYINYLLLLPIVLALILSLQNLGSNSLWLDEAWSVAIANLSWGNFWEYVAHDELNMTFYYSILKIWVAFFGDSEFATRFLSVVFSVCTIVMVYFLGVRLFDHKTGIAAGIILAVNAYFIQYSQEVKGYTLYLFMATASSYYFIDVLKNLRLKNCSLYVIISVLMVYNHFFGLLILLSQAISVPFLCHEKTNLKKLFLCMLSIALLVAPVGLFILLNGKDNALGWVRKTSLKDFVYLFYNLTGDTGSGKLLLVYFIPCFLSLDISVQHYRESGITGLFWRYYAFLLNWMLIPIAITFLFSVVIKPVFVTRYLITSLIPLVLLVAVGLTKIRNKLLYGIAICGIAFVSVGAVYDDYYPKQKDDWRSATQYVLNNSIKGDGIILYGPSAKLPFEYYYKRISTQKEILDCIYPSSFGMNEITWESDDKLLNAISGRHERIWCVLWNDIFPGIGWDSRPALKKLEANYIIRNEIFYRKIKIILFIKDTPQTRTVR